MDNGTARLQRAIFRVLLVMAAPFAWSCGGQTTHASPTPVGPHHHMMGMHQGTACADGGDCPMMAGDHCAMMGGMNCPMMDGGSCPMMVDGSCPMADGGPCPCRERHMHGRER